METYLSFLLSRNIQRRNYLCKILLVCNSSTLHTHKKTHIHTYVLSLHYIYSYLCIYIYIYIQKYDTIYTVIQYILWLCAVIFFDNLTESRITMEIEACFCVYVCEKKRNWRGFMLFAMEHYRKCIIRPKAMIVRPTIQFQVHNPFIIVDSKLLT